MKRSDYIPGILLWAILAAVVWLCGCRSVTVNVPTGCTAVTVNVNQSAQPSFALPVTASSNTIPVSLIP